MATTELTKIDTETSVPELTKLPEQEPIASRAYALWQARDCPDGSPDVDWFQAEQELRTSR